MHAVLVIPGYPWNLLVCWNIHHNYLMHRSPRVYRTPPRTTRPFSRGHSYSSFAHSISLLVVVSSKNSLLVTRQSMALEGGGWLYFIYNREKNRNKKYIQKFQLCRGFSALPGRGSMTFRVRSFHLTSRGSMNVERIKFACC